jgi:nitronate monooxygenase
MSQSRRHFLGTAPALGGALLTASAAAQRTSTPWPSARTKALLDRFGLSVPIFQAGFGSVTSVPLAAAVSNAGAMGALGTLNAGNAKERVTSLRAATKGPFFVNMILQLYPANPPDILPICLDAGAPIVQFSWGIPSREAVSMIRVAHARFGMQVTSRESARAALDAGADFLICQGTEAGGHVQAHRGLYEVLPEVLDEAKETPVVAAGGIGNGAAIYKALSAGAGAALLGTRFVATAESNAHEQYKKAVIAAKAGDTALTMCFQDRWPQLHRALRNSTFHAWDAAGCPPPGKRPGEGDVTFTRADGSKILRYYDNPPLVGCAGERITEAALYAGMGVGVVKDLPPAGELVKRLWDETLAAHRGTAKVPAR